MGLAQGSSPFLRAKDLIEPRGRPYLLIAPGVKYADFDIVTYGRDGVPGGEGADADVVD